MDYVLACIQDAHDQRLLAMAALVCLVGVYASFLLSKHAVRSRGTKRRLWGLTAIIAAAATAWATHMIGLLAYRPGLQFAFDPVLTVLSLVVTVVGIAAGMSITIGQHDIRRRFAGGLVVGVSIVLLHYMGQASYLVRARQSFDLPLASITALLGTVTFGVALVVSGLRRKNLRGFATPMLLLGIAIMHFGGMSALTIVPDPDVRFPPFALPAQIVAPIVAAVSVALLLLALLGLRFSVAAKRHRFADAKRLSELADLTVEGIVVFADGQITSINASLERLSGHSRAQIEGKPLAFLFGDADPEKLPLLEESEAQLVRRDNNTIPVRILRSEVALGAKTQRIIAVRDQRERMRTESRMRALAYTDMLTGLPNRLSVIERMQALTTEGDEGGRGFAFLLLDLDRFKWVNDTLGHFVGDELLKQVAWRLQAQVGPDDFVGRLGGDEFAVIVRGDANAAAEVARRLVDAHRSAFVIGVHSIEVKASVGIAVASSAFGDHEDLSRNADLALYRAKEDGGAGFRFYEAAMHERVQQRRQMETDLQQALASGGFTLHYQPQVSPLTGRLSGAEALLRWQHPTRGMVPPDQFIPLAEEVGLIGPIGEWVLRTACREAATWPGNITVAVNLSAVQLQNSLLPDLVEAVLAETGMRAHLLELEVTETSLIKDNDTTYNNLRQLQALGVRISLDDFGTGYSSLNYLRRFPFNKLKIDRSFVQNVPHDEDSVAIVQAIVTLATKLRMTVTAEGVETLEQRAFAAANGCHQIQGYLVSRAVPATELMDKFLLGVDQRHIA